MRRKEKLFEQKARFLIFLQILFFTQNFYGEDNLFLSGHSGFELEIQKSGVECSLWDVSFIDSLYGWAVGDSGTVIATIDGGITWRRVLEKVDTLEFKEIHFLNNDIGYIGGNIIKKFPTYEARHVILLKTTNGGLTWERSDSIFDSDFLFGHMQFLDSENGWVALNRIDQTSFSDRKGVLLKTTNGGRSWSIQQEKKGVLIGTFTFVDNKIGYSFWSPFFDNFDDTEVDYTSSGGSEWIPISRIKEDGVSNAKCFLSKIVWGIGYGISVSRDGGLTWNSWNWFTAVPEGQKRFIPKDIEVFDSVNVWIIGNAWSSLGNTDYEGLLLSTSDLGKNWRIELQVPYHFIHAVSVVDGKKGWLVGSGGLIIHLKNIVTSINKDARISSMPILVDQNYPNPFNASTKIRYFLPTPCRVRLEIFDMLGRKVRTLVNENKERGWYEAIWDGRDEANVPMPSGVYFYRMLSNGRVLSKKIMLIR